MKYKTFIFDSDALKSSMRIRTNDEAMVFIIAGALYLVDDANYCRVYEKAELRDPLFRPDLSFGVKAGNDVVPELPINF